MYSFFFCVYIFKLKQRFLHKYFILLFFQIQVVNGVVLISWRESVLQKQIDYGAKIGHVVLSLAKMELENFFKNVTPVAEYFDQSDMLIAVVNEKDLYESVFFFLNMKTIFFLLLHLR